jgi:hypothetical protein
MEKVEVEVEVEAKIGSFSLTQILSPPWGVWG